MVETILIRNSYVTAVTTFLQKCVQVTNKYLAYPFHHGFCRENRVEGNDQNLGLSKLKWKGKLRPGSLEGLAVCCASPLSTITTDGSNSMSKSGV